jgi:ribonuclease P protein component
VRFGKAARILRRREFLAVQQRGERLFAGKLVVLALHAGGDRPRIGITVPGKVANAVIRNRIKRWVREAYRAVAADLPPVDLVVIARSGAGEIGLDGARLALGAARDRLIRGARR